MQAYVGQPQVYLASYGPAYVGLPVAYTLYNPDGSVYQARTAAGVRELGRGDYEVPFTLPALWAGYIEWDTGGGSPVAIREEVNVVDPGAAALAAATGVNVTYLGPVAQTGAISVLAGDDYYTADGRSLTWVDGTGTSWPNLAGGSVQLLLHPVAAAVAAPAPYTAVIEQPTGVGKVVHVEWSAAQTTALALGNHGYNYDLVATLANGRKATLASGRVDVN